MIKELVSKNRSEGKGGLICVCSAHPHVLEAAFDFLKNNPEAILSIESTVQQVNQDGGYTGMTPQNFVANVRGMARARGISDQSYILAGDHLGPNAWKNMSAEDAMQKSLVLVEEYVKAGYTKLHIDPSMSCENDPTPLSVEIIAERTAIMVKKAEETAIAILGSSDSLFYVVGTEVPVPGGSQEHEDHISVTPLDEVKHTISVIKKSLEKYNLSHVWSKVKGIVVQPGVEFGDDFVFPYQEGQAVHLEEAISSEKHLVYEAHSTDYQTRKALSGLVKDHFAILKVGPELTFAWRESLFAMDMIEQENVAIKNKSGIRVFLEEKMLKSPAYWQGYYSGSPEEQSFKRVYSLSDRIRYYWSDSQITEKIEKSLPSIQNSLSYSLISQYLPWVVEYNEKYGYSDFSVERILRWSVERVIQKYFDAVTKI